MDQVNANINTRNFRSERRSRQLVRQYDLSHVPIVLVHQFFASVRSS